MRKAYINLPDSQMVASEYQVEIKYVDGKTLKEKIVNYSYSNVFEWIKEKHEGEHDQEVRSVKIDLIR